MDVAGTPGVSMPMAPIAANGMVFIGNAGGDQTGVTGHVYALDAQDGRVVWRFEVVPDEPAVRATWPNADRYPITGGAFWTSFALDTERGVLYVPAGNPAPDFDVQARGGDNLYTNSLIALDAATGRIVGYNQLVKRDEHDWDVNGPPALGVTRAGRPIVASANKDGLLSVLDRSALASGPPPAGGGARNAPADDLSIGHDDARERRRAAVAHGARALLPRHSRRQRVERRRVPSHAEHACTPAPSIGARVCSSRRNRRCRRPARSGSARPSARSKGRRARPRVGSRPSTPTPAPCAGSLRRRLPWSPASRRRPAVSCSPRISRATCARSTPIRAPCCSSSRPASRSAAASSAIRRADGRGSAWRPA